MEFAFIKKISDFSDLVPVFRYRIPTFLIGAFIRFIKRIESITGISFGIILPSEILHHDIKLLSFLAKAELFKEFGIFEHYYPITTNYPDEPPIAHRWYGKVATSHYKGTGLDGYGYDFFNERKAFCAMLGEGIERWAVVHYDPPVSHDCVDASFKELKKEGALDIFSLAGYTKALREKGDKMYDLRFDEESFFRWVRGRSLVSDRPLWIPLQLVSFARENILKKREESFLLSRVTTGMAAHEDFDKATLGGILETIERDAFMIYWLNKLTPHVINIASIKDRRLFELSERFKKYKLELYALYLKTDVPAHVVATLIVDRSGVGPAVSVGASAGLDLADAVYRSLCEAYVTHLAVRRNKSSAFSESKSEYKNPSEIGHLERLDYWYPVEKIKYLDFWLSGEKKDFRIFPVYPHTMNVKDQLRFLFSYFRDNRYEVTVNKILSEELTQKVDMTVAVVNIPEFQPLHLLEWLPCEGGRRLHEVPHMLGYKPLAILNTLPHMFP